MFLGTQRDNIHDCMRKRRFTVGERSHHAKLNNDQAREIRERCHAGERYGSLAQEFGVTYETILLIAKARIWRHLDATPPTPVYEPPRPHRWCGPIIKAMYDSGYTQAALAVMFGCDQTIISDVLVEPFK